MDAPVLAEYALGDLPLRNGGVLRDAQITYAIFGELNRRRDNCILMPTYFTGDHVSNARMIGPGRALDPRQYCIVVPNLFGNGWSSSPTKAHASQTGVDFPSMSIADNIRAQHRLLTEQLQVERLKLIYGWSMGAIQGYQWAVDYPEFVERLMVVCGSARCWPQNQLFIWGLRAILELDPQFAAGRYHTPPAQGLRAFGRAYCGWAYSPAFFRERLYLELGFASLEELVADWEADHLAWDANNLLCKLAQWETANPAHPVRDHGDLAQALRRIKALTWVMPCTTDRYFTAEENAWEAALIPRAEFRPLAFPQGHCAGSPGRFAAPMRQIDERIRALLALAAGPFD